LYVTVGIAVELYAVEHMQKMAGDAFKNLLKIRPAELGEFYFFPRLREA